ncbi:MAG: UDP-N-acetylglucosamine 1-carboxyvinyltransferase [Legionellales bacterium]|nr:UDP-N-acetylglucosamine 1-carboxyvinyltransferase [Legionellales bacterium]OUX67671.1 MAG: UDP-N-acetylglucosamine 1-carboxyvinyltransferase [bacterium TMED178]|tara:strand:- start:592 stop:1866 length:1275 start_codon:yes stop_codon:yes gene_type:complete
MQNLLIQGPSRIAGSVYISGSKNSALPILSATILCTNPVVIQKVPHLKDVTTMLSLLSNMGMTFSIDHELNVFVENSTLSKFEAPYDLVKQMRASVLVLGPTLARYGYAKVSLPGGCAIGTRPVDQHLKILCELGAEVKVEDGYIIASTKKLIGKEVRFDRETVTGTENILMAACLAQGKTVIHNAACEPEVKDLADFLNSMGAKIQGAGTSTIEIVGVNELGGGAYSVIPDRIEAGTLLIAAVMTQGQIKLIDCIPEHLTSCLDVLKQAGAKVETTDHTVSLKMDSRPKSVSIVTDVYPGIPTDLQAQFIAMNAIAEGSSCVEETIFENRFMHVSELTRMGAQITLNRNVVQIQGVDSLVGARVMATDLRASAALILAGISAQGLTSIDRIYHIDRGYANIQEKLIKLGANIERQTSKPPHYV